MSVLNVGIIGCGHIGGEMALTLHKTRGFRAYAAASRDLDKAIGFAKRNHVKKAYGSYEELVRDRRVDLVYIATPHSEHYAHAKLCIENGKPCLVEKAFTVTRAQAAELFDMAEENRVFITEAIWTRYMPFVQTIREVMGSGVIGQPVLLTAGLGYPVKGKKRLTDPALAGGTLLDLGVYPINLASMLFGDDILRAQIGCTYTSCHLDEQENISLVYRDGRMASLTASMLGVTDRNAVISGTRGYIVIENINNYEGMTVYGADHRKIASYKRPRQKTGYEYELFACRDALKEGRLECPQMPHAETLFMLQIMDDLRAQAGVVYPAERGEEAAEPVCDSISATPQEDMPEAEAAGGETLRGEILRGETSKEETVQGETAERGEIEVTVSGVTMPSMPLSGETEDSQGEAAEEPEAAGLSYPVQESEKPDTADLSDPACAPEEPGTVNLSGSARASEELQP